MYDTIRTGSARIGTALRKTAVKIKKNTVRHTAHLFLHLTYIPPEKIYSAPYHSVIRRINH